MKKHYCAYESIKVRSQKNLHSHYVKERLRELLIERLVEIKKLMA